MNEIFKDVKGYEGCYQVSNLGRVKSLTRILLLSKDRCGYYNATLSKNGRVFKTGIHRLMCIAFIPNPENKKTVNHINGIKDDNRLENLEWNTHSENVKHGYDLGLQIRSTGETHGIAITNDKDVLKMREMKASNKYTTREICDFFNLTYDHVSKILRGKIWKHLL